MGHKSLKNILSMDRSKSYTTDQQISVMYDVVSTKWDQCTEMREYCKAAHCDDMIYIEGTESNFWGGGTDITEVTDNFEIADFKGRNILGWIITRVVAEKLGKMGPWRDRVSAVRTSKKNKFVLMYVGLMQVNKAINLLQEKKNK